MNKRIDIILGFVTCFMLGFLVSATITLSEWHLDKSEEVRPVYLAFDGMDLSPEEEEEAVQILTAQKSGRRAGEGGEEVVDVMGTYEVEPLTTFQLYDIDLSEDLQMHTYKLSKLYQVDMDIILAIMWHESRFIADVRDNVNTNGSHDRGLMQINQVNWGWLADRGLDVNDPYDNIECGVLMLSMLLEKYDTSHALMAYQCGEGRMKELAAVGYTTQFVYEIMEIEFEQI